jgi:hypothetical protein
LGIWSRLMGEFAYQPSLCGGLRNLSCQTLMKASYRLLLAIDKGHGQWQG